MCLNHVIHVHHSTKEPEAPTNLKATNSGSTEVTLQWTKPKVTTKEGLSYNVSSTEMSGIFDKSSGRISEMSSIFRFLYIINSIIIHLTEFPFSVWPKECSEFSMSSYCRLYNNHFKDTPYHWSLVIMLCMTVCALCGSCRLLHFFSFDV